MPENDNTWKPITPEQAELLVNRIIHPDDDAAALALVALIHSITHTPEYTDRDDLANRAIDRAYARTMEFGTATEVFITRAYESMEGASDERS